MRETEALERTDALRLAQQVAAALSTGEPLEGLPEAAACIADALGFARAALLITLASDPDAIVLIANSDEPTLTHLRLRVADYPEIASALRSRRPVFAGEASLAPLSGETIDVADTLDGQEAALASEPASLLVLPLAPEGRPLGCLSLRAAGVRPPPDEGELRALRIAAQVLAVALKSGRVLEWLGERTRRASLDAFEDARRAQEMQRYRAFFESAADGVVVLDRELCVLYANRAAEQVTGYARTALAGRPLLDLVPPAERDGMRAIALHAAAGTQLAGFDFSLVTTSGETLRMSASTSTLSTEHGAIALSFRDVTVARALEDELRAAKEFLQRLVDAAPDGIVAADRRGRILVFNAGAERVFGWRADEVVGKLHVARLWPDGGAREIMAELRAGGGRLEPRRRVVQAKGGERVPVQLAASIVYEEGREAATVGIFNDLRERVQMERRLEETQEKLALSEKQALIAELAGTTAHELNQPLTSVMGYAELLRRRLAGDESSRRAVEIVLREAERMAEIVRKIGTITKYETKPYVGSSNILDLEKSTR